MILFRYLAKEILVSMFAVSATLLVIVMSGRFVKYLAQAASGDLAPDVVLNIMMFRLPSFLELVLPLGLFIAIMLAYGRMYVESEMTVMSACGLSVKRLSLYTLFPSLLVAAAVAYLSLYASPVGIGKVQEIFDDTKNSNGLELLVAGRFRVDDKTGRVTYIKGLDKDGQVMQEVFSAEQTGATKSEQQLSVVFADEGTIQVDEASNARYLLLEQGYQYVGQPGQKKFRVTQFGEFGQLIEEPEERRASYKKSDARSTQELLQSEKIEDKATLQWRISLAILVPIVALIAQALSKTNHRRGRYVKMLPAFLIYIFYLVGLNAARDAVEKGKIPLEFGLWWVHLIFLLLAMLLLFGSDSWRRWRGRGGDAGSGNMTESGGLKNSGGSGA